MAAAAVTAGDMAAEGARDQAEAARGGKILLVNIRGYPQKKGCRLFICILFFAPESSLRLTGESIRCRVTSDFSLAAKRSAVFC